ncbi:MAG TPA: phosphatase PAP2 family protein [bacterium]|nr:phosphatase PAP2 family protein [bacterium]HQG44399.1 phosphatase PAP2 family protein [bacterium]HQI47377.1 phosphatase PAP2 family protein [bacterium]HQJ63021.1 phosphatase PAP2 family protein [bacterium]
MTRHATLWLLLISFLLVSPAAVEAKEAVQTAGDVLLVALPATAAGMTWYHHDCEGVMQLARVSSLTLGVTTALKYLINEKRPDGGKYGFPSGHASVTFCAAEFIRKRYGWRPGLPAYAAALFTAWSRVESRRHYTHDVLAGAALGAGSSYLFTRPAKGVHLQLGAGGRGYNIRLSCVW